MEKLGEICAGAREAWGDPEGIGIAMKEAHLLLRDLGLSTPKLEKIVGKCAQLGALGAKLTGSGLGGCAIALFESASKAKAARRAFSDFDTWAEEI